MSTVRSFSKGTYACEVSFFGNRGATGYVRRSNVYTTLYITRHKSFEGLARPFLLPEDDRRRSEESSSSVSQSSSVLSAGTGTVPDNATSLKLNSIAVSS
jgi:hypothetical protein